MKANNYENIIAGPCSVESRDQFLLTVGQLRALGINNIRGGVWKPRTKPGGFEGLGEKAFDFIEEAKISDSMFCEVANAKQLEIALSHGVKGIWIGARTTVDPFAVQEVADGLREAGCKDLIVGVKNPVCPDLDLWEGAIQRIQNACIPMENIIAIFRGFKTYSNSKYRNEPIWRIPLELKSRMPELKMYIDPSHIAGKRVYVEEILNVAFNVYDYDGAIVECHCNPNEAWTDAKQQLEPKELVEMLDRVHAKVVEENSSTSEQKLKHFRDEIDEIDNDIINCLAKRLQVSKEIGKCKSESHMKVYQKDRWQEVINKVAAKARDLGIDEDYLLDIWEIIHEKSIEEQK